MSSHLTIPIPELDELDDADDLFLEDDGYVPEWHKKILDDLLAKYKREGFHGIPLEEFEIQLKEFRKTLTKQ